MIFHQPDHLVSYLWRKYTFWALSDVCKNNWHPYLLLTEEGSQITIASPSEIDRGLFFKLLTIIELVSQYTLCSIAAFKSRSFVR